LFISGSDQLAYKLVSDLIVLVIVSFLFIALIGFLEKRKTSPFSMIMNIGILSAIFFFLITFSRSIMSLLFENVNGKIINPGLDSTIITLGYFLLIIGFITYVFTALRHLFYLKQSRAQQIYFNTMIIFFVLASISAQYFSSEELSFIRNTFLIVSILLMVINSLRISWIAFMVKKEKIALLVLSTVIAVLFIVNLSNSGSDTVHSTMLNSFSPSLNEFGSIIMLYGAIYFSVLFFTTLFHIPTAEAFDRKAQEVSSLQYFSKLITQVLDFDELAETVTDITTTVSGADASWIIWKEKDDFVPIAIKNIGFVDSDIINKFILQKISWDNLNETTFIKLGEFDGQLKLSQPYKAIAVSPLKAQGSVKGLLIAVRKDEKKFNEEDKNAIATFSDYASVSIENSGLLEESIEKERLEKELDVAREIQKKIIPEKNPDYNGLEISSTFIPAFEVGGDYYDFFEISETKLGFVIADVSGKGISAALIMAQVKGIFESLSKLIESPREILIKANDILKRTLDSKTFVSAAYGLIDVEDGQMIIARAGHCPVLLLRNETANSMKPSGIGLGISEVECFDQNLDEMIIDFEMNDTIVLFTDGITEAKNENLDDFGDKYFTEILLENRNKNADELSKKVIQEVSTFSHNQSQYDDITLVILKWKQKIKTDGEKIWQNSAPQL
jgi:serine phosphatase RsbU (regulator of sigma subunit)